MVGASGGLPPDAILRTMSAGEAPVKQAVKWLDDQLRDNPQADRVSLIDEAARRFDLSPLDSDFLYRHLSTRGRPA